MNTYHIPNLGKACEVLNLISNTPGGIRLKQICAQLDIPRTTALRITQTLLHAGYLAERDDGNLTLGTAMIQLGVKALDSLDIRGYARPILKKLAAEIEENCHLAILNGTQSLLIEVADSPHLVRIAARPGTLVDLHCSSTGKIFLAFSIPEPQPFIQTLKLKPYTKNTDSTPDAVLASLAKTRKQGYTIDDEEYVLGVRCVAAPVVNSFGKTIAAVGITASTATFTKAKIPLYSKKIIQAAHDISKNMGFHSAS